ncbi:hypothetical protein HF1_11210 [Mycoplasma haemofelis str. Langford 1]|uniref:Uncharacterized protein n=1 Tax=Mycoplasma haemofelis (strain Langford 1) TaxID=941640 RepID=E8ZJ08_MYCHL|nr:hypothetical protein [Mycoplasma haemofelis]CBY93129.1 hypothetical protein HF1_11210 [Mycoplasma haemofelis str. Langford 1]
MDPKMLGLMGGVGAVGAGGAYLAVANSSKEGQLISELIRSEAFVKPLTKNDKDNAKWNEAWKRYRDAHKVSASGSEYKDKDIWGLSEWGSKRSGNDAFDEFKNKCEEKSRLKVDSDSQEYRDFKNYCARPKTVSELIGEEGKVTLLKKDGSNDSTAWNAAWEVYRKANLKDGQTSEYKDQDIWSVQNWSTDKSSADAKEHYKTKCEEKANLDIDVNQGLKDSNFINVKNWCTKAS